MRRSPLLALLSVPVLAIACSDTPAATTPAEATDAGTVTIADGAVVVADGAIVAPPPPDGAAPPPPGDSLFDHPMPWTKDVSGLAPSSESSKIINGLQAAGGWGTGAFTADLGIHVLTADATPLRNFTPTDDFYEPDCDHIPYPVPANGALESETGYRCTTDGDCHLIVVDPGKRLLYEMWRGDIQGANFRGGCAVLWDLTKAYDPATLRGKGCTSADAAGFPITAMLATPDEVFAGEVKHALRFILPNSRIQNGMYVPPATHSTPPTSGGPNTPPYGVRFRLKASFDVNTLASKGARVLANALKKYGMFLADGGELPLTMSSDRFTAHKWSEVNVTPSSLGALRVTDFEVVDLGARVNWKANTDCTRNP